MTNVSRTNQNGLRPDTDLYSTTYDATRSFVAHELARLQALFGPHPLLHEPAAGEGWIAQVCEDHGLRVIESDLHLHPRARPAPVIQQDFMTLTHLLAPLIVTNPPYNVGRGGQDFVRHALRLAPVYAAFLMPIGFVAGITRRDIHDTGLGGLRLARVLVITWRLTLKPRDVAVKNKGVVTYAWIVFERGHEGAPTLHRLYRVELPPTRFVGAGRAA